MPQTGFRAIPVNELVDGMTIPALGAGTGQAVQDRSVGMFKIGQVGGHLRGKRGVWLSITHKLSTEYEAVLDICEARESSPHDGVSWRRVFCSSEIASEASEFSQVEGERIG